MKATRPLRIRVPAVAAAVLLTALTFVTPGVASADQYSDADAAIALINDARASAGVAPLTADGYLGYLAQSWATTMRDGGFLAHNPDLWWEMGDWWQWGENVGRGPSVEVLHDAFMNSYHHYLNIVDPTFTSVGVGVAYADDGRLYIAVVFGG